MRQLHPLLQQTLKLVCRAGTLAIAGDLGGLKIANTGTGTVYTSGVSSGAATAVSGSGKTVIIPSGGKTLVSSPLSPTPFPAVQLPAADCT